MTIDKLIRDFDDIIIDCKKIVPSCIPEEGIRFFLPAPLSTAEGTVFAGSMSEWKLLIENSLLLDGCTYLICRENDSHLPQISSHTEKKCNCLFLNATVQTVLQRLTESLNGSSLSQSPSVTQVYMDFWKDILSFRLTEKKQVTARLNTFPYPVHPHIACILVRSTRKRTDISYQEDVLHALQDFFPNTNICPTASEWIILYSQKKDTSDSLDISYKAFSGLLSQYQLEAGISYVCQLPEMLHVLYQTAAASIDLGKQLSFIKPTTKRIYTYHQYNTYYVIHLCTQTFVKQYKTENLLYLTHPDITRIYYYDSAKNNNLLDVLYTYLYCDRNLNRTSEMLFMHRNTILNKLSKIESLLQHKIDYESDHFLLLMSCMIFKYQHAYMKRNINEYFSSVSLEDENEYPH